MEISWVSKVISLLKSVENYSLFFRSQNQTPDMLTQAYFGENILNIL